jgi:hypothetical protein
MKKTYILLGMAIVVLFAGVACAAEPTVNLIKDGGFEEGIYGWTGWPTFPMTRSTEHVHGGKYSIGFPQGELTQVGGDQRKGQWISKSMESRPFLGEPGATYRFKAYGFSEKGDAPAKLSVSFGGKVFRSQFPSQNIEIPSDGAWHEVAVEYTIPDDLPDGETMFQVFLGTGGKVWIDDLELVKSKPAPVAPVGITWKTKTYFTSQEPVRVACALKNQTGAALKFTFNGSVNLPDLTANRFFYPNDVYKQEKQKWPSQSVSLGAGESKEIELSLEGGKFPNTGLLFIAAVQGEDGKTLAKSRREVLICDRSDWRKEFSVGAQYYESDNTEGHWLQELKEAGVDSVRQCMPLPFCYRENIPGVNTDWPVDLCLAYYGRIGLKWLSAYWTVVGYMPSWLLEDPKNRITMYDGTVRGFPYSSYHIKKVREALYQDAENQSRVILDNPIIAGVQNDNELNVVDEYGPDAQASFRDYIKREFGDIAKVNEAWGTTLKSFDDVKQPAPMQTSPILQGSSGTDLPQPEKRIPAKDFIWMKWREDCMTAYHRGWTEHFKKGAPDIPVTCNFMLPYWSHPQAYFTSPINLFRYAEFYDCGGIDAGAHDMGRAYNQYAFDFLNSAWGNRAIWIPESYYNWNKLDKNTVGFNLFFYMGRKVMHYEFFCWPSANAQAKEGYSAAPTGERRVELLKEIKKEIGEAKDFDRKYKAESLEYIVPQVGIYWSNELFCFPNALGKSVTWLSGTDSVSDLDKVLSDVQIPVRMVDKERLLKDKEEGIKLLFVGGAYVLDRPVMEKFLDFANAGGVVFFNGPVGSYDGHMVKTNGLFSGKGDALGASAENWKGGSQILVVPKADLLVKVPAGKKLRGFGRFEKVKLSPDWRVLLELEDGSPALAVRSQGKGMLLWSLTDMASPYGLYHSAQTRQLVEGLLEYLKIGRPGVAYAASTGKAAPDVTLTARRKSDAEHFIFYNNFGAAGDYALYLNFPEKDASITDALSGEKVEFKPEKGYLKATLKMERLGYGVLRITSMPVNIKTPPAAVIEEATTADKAVSGSDAAKAVNVGSTAAGNATQCAVREEKAVDGSAIYWLDGPFNSVAVSPSHGGRVVHLSSAGRSTNMLLPLKEVFAEGALSEVAGLKAIVDPKGGTYGNSIVLKQAFDGVEKKSDPEKSSLKWSAKPINQADGKTLTVEEEVRIERGKPVISWVVRQSHQSDIKLRLYAHMPLLLGGEAASRVQFTVGSSEGLFSARFQKGGAGRAIPLEAKGKVLWAAIGDQESRTTLICIPVKAFSQVRFWNDGLSYNLEAASEFQNLKAQEVQEGQLDFYPCKDLDLVTFVGENLAGTFLSSDEGSPSQNVDLNVCALDGKAHEVTLQLSGIPRAAGQEERALGEIQMQVEPLKGNARKISLGGSGTGFASYRLYLKNEKGKTLLGEIPNRWKVQE